MLKLRTFSLLSILFFASACEGDPRHTTPEGRVAGEVLDAMTHVPLSGAEVNLLLGGKHLKTTRTDELGRYVIDRVPAGSELWLDIKTAGYPVHRYFPKLDDAAGEEAQSNSIILQKNLLFPLVKSELKIEVKNTEKDSPQTGVEVYVQGKSRAESGQAFELPELIIGKTDAVGVAMIAGIAAEQAYDVWIFQLTESNFAITSEGTFKHDFLKESKLDLGVVPKAQ